MNTDRKSSPVLHPQLLLQLLDLPVSFHRCLVPITGSITAALMLSQAIWTTQENELEMGAWFTKSRDEWTNETGLSRWEQQSARKALRTAGFIEEQRLGTPAKLWYRVRADRIWCALRNSVVDDIKA
jgi:hypothetical protein